MAKKSKAADPLAEKAGDLYSLIAFELEDCKPVPGVTAVPAKVAPDGTVLRPEVKGRVAKPGRVPFGGGGLAQEHYQTILLALQRVAEG